MKLQQLQIFVTVAEEQNFTSAAKRLYLSQPTISREIQSLENELGCLLFVRQERVLRLTDPGRRLLPEAKQILEKCSHLKELAIQNPCEITGSIKIGYMASGQLDILTQRLGSFINQYTGIDLETIYDSPMNAMESFKRGKTDVLLTVRAGLPPKHGPVVVLQRDSFSIMVAKGNPFFDRETVNLTELQDQTIVTTDPTQLPSLCHAYFEICQRSGFTPKVCGSGKKIADIKLQMQRYNAIAFVGLEFSFMSKDDYRIIPIEGSYPETDSVAVFHKHPLSESVTLLLNRLQQSCKDQNRNEYGDGN